MTDVRIEHTEEGGEITITNGRVDTGDGLRTAAYLSLFGGNEDDSGLEGDDPRQWWANHGEKNEARHIRSETQFLLRTLAATPANVRRIENAAGRDLEWMTEDFAESVQVSATLPALNRISIEVTIRIDAKEHDFTFTEDWTDQ